MIKKATNQAQRVVSGMYLGIGEMVLILRRRAQTDLEELAAASGVGVDTLNYLENCEYDKVTLLDMAAIGEVLGVYMQVGVSRHPAEFISYDTIDEEE